MELELLQSLPNLGGAVIIALLSVHFFRDMQKSHKEERDEHNKNYRAYVETNNHQKTQMFEEQLKTMRSFQTSIDRLADKIK